MHGHATDEVRHLKELPFVHHQGGLVPVNYLLKGEDIPGGREAERWRVVIQIEMVVSVMEQVTQQPPTQPYL